MTTVILYLAAALLLGVSALRSRTKTHQAIRVAWRSFLGLLPMMLGTIGLIGLVMAVLPGSAIGNLFGTGGVIGLLLISLVGAVTLIPAFIAFPLAASLLRAGAGVAPLATFITTLTMVGVVTAPMEMEFFGRRFTVARNLISYIFALAVGVVMGVILQ